MCLVLQKIIATGEIKYQHTYSYLTGVPSGVLTLTQISSNFGLFVAEDDDAYLLSGTSGGGCLP